MKGNLLLFVSLFAGILVGMTGAMPHWLLNPQLPMLLLELLIVQVGMGIGSMEHLDRLFAGFRWEMLLLPVFTIVGTLLFSATAVLLFSGHSLSDFLAVGSGFGYYSLSSVLISQVKAGAVGSAAANQLATKWRRCSVAALSLTEAVDGQLSAWRASPPWTYACLPS